MSLSVLPQPNCFCSLQNSPEAQDNAHEEADNHLRECMLPQDHAAAAHQSRDENHETEPPDRVEGKENRERYERPSEATDGCRMRTLMTAQTICIISAATRMLAMNCGMRSRLMM